MQPILVTGCAGFIGYHLSNKLLLSGLTVVGIDNLNDYYDVKLKNDRLQLLKYTYPDRFIFTQLDLNDITQLDVLFSDYQFQYVVNLAAQAGVRHSLVDPYSYIHSNIKGFTVLLELCRKFSVKHLLYASSSSVYGGNTDLPFKETHNVDHPLNIYAASKKSNELMAHSYSHLFNLPTTGLRFFTVYGPWGRPDMALFLFTNSIVNDLPINVFNNGNMIRDFTFVHDIVAAVEKLLFKPPKSRSIGNKPKVPYNIFNIGNSSPVSLLDYISELEKCLGKKANKNFMPMQPGDSPSTYADVSHLNHWIGYKPNTSIEDGISQFVHWYKSYYDI